MLEAEDMLLNNSSMAITIVLFLLERTAVLWGVTL